MIPDGTALGFATAATRFASWSRREAQMVGSFAKVQGVDDLPVGLFVVPLEVFQEPPTLAHHFQQPPAGIEISFVGLKVLGEMSDALCEECHLDLGRSRIRVVLAKLLDRRLMVCRHAHLTRRQYTPRRAARQAVRRRATSRVCAIVYSAPPPMAIPPHATTGGRRQEKNRQPKGSL